MEYKVLNRPKLARNKYGDVKDKDSVGGTSFFSSSSSNGGSSSSSTNIGVFEGSTSTEDGTAGLVPAPKTNNDEALIANDNQKFLKGSGAWVDIPISRYTTENSNKNGIDFNGNLKVSDTLTTQTLNVEGSAHFWELVIDKVKAAGGNLLITPSNFTIDYLGSVYSYKVDETVSPFKEMFYDEELGTGILGLKELFTKNNITYLFGRRLYMRNSDGDNQIVSEFEVGDMIRCKTLNLDTENGFTNKDYWTFVLKTGTETYSENPCMYIDVFYLGELSDKSYFNLGDTLYNSDNETQEVDLPEFKFGYGTFEPAVGDNVVSLGHLWKGERQGAILISSSDPMDTELEAPALAQYQGINTFTSLSNFRTTSIAANGNKFEGTFLVNYNGNYVDVNERINIFNADLTTGLEKCGIHLDGENSTIKLVGSVEIKQNSDGKNDTFTVWDEDEIMRVKVSPEEIPSKSNIQTSINPTSLKDFTTLSKQTIPTSGSVEGHHSYKYFLGSKWNHKYWYNTTNAYFIYNQTLDIGKYSSGQSFTISNLSSKIKSKAYFKGTVYTDNRGTEQSISKVILRLRRYNGSTWSIVQSYDFTDSSTIVVDTESVSISYPTTLLSNYQVTTDGNYRIELEIIHNVYAESAKYSSKQSNVYFNFTYTCNSSVTLTQPSASMTRIGRNGIVFNTDLAGQYFYAGNDGIEMKWGESSITLDSSTGLKFNYATTHISTASSTIPSDVAIAFCDSFTTDTTVYLPKASTYGIGRILTIVGNDYLLISGNTTEELIYKSIGTSSNKSSNCLATYQRMSLTNSPIVRLMCTGTGWLFL